ncbi:MAG: hypothetical protein AAF581_12035 [Planctomycetota bacterium]
MTARSIAEALIGILGLYFVFESIVFRLNSLVVNHLLTPASELASETAAQFHERAMHSGYLTIGVEVGLGILVFLARKRIARLVTDDSAVDRQVPAPDGSRLLAIGICVIGVWLVASALPGLAMYFYDLAQAQASQASLVYYVAQVAVGALLALRAPGIRSALRAAGPMTSEPSEW